MERLKELVPGKRYTLVAFGEMGFLYQIQMTLQEVRVQPYAQYPVSYCLVFVPERKRTARMVRFYDDVRFIVWDGWVYPNTEMWVSKETKFYEVEGKEERVDCKQSWLCFDQKYLTRAKLSVEKEPLMEVMYYKKDLQNANT